MQQAALEVMKENQHCVSVSEDRIKVWASDEGIRDEALAALLALVNDPLNCCGGHLDNNEAVVYADNSLGNPSIRKAAELMKAHGVNYPGSGLGRRKVGP